MAVRVSVVVPTYGRASLLSRCLQSLVEQDYPPDQFEIIVADDRGGTADTLRAVEDAIRQQRLPVIRYLPVAGPGPAAARNAGWRAANGEIVAFTDDDCLPEPGWLAAIVGALSDGASGGWGRLIVPLPASPTDYELNAALMERSAFVTANCFCRRDVLVSVGGFDERFTAAWREDSDLYFRLVQSGARLVHVPHARVLHPVRPAPWGISLSQQWKSQFNALLYKKHPRLYREMLQPVTPLHYYAIVAALILAIGGLASAYMPMTVTGAVVWFGLSTRFCLCRLRDTSRSLRHVSEMIVTSALIPPLSVFWRLAGAVRFRVLFW